MDSNDLSTALLVARVAMQNRSTFDIASKELTEGILNFKKKPEYKFMAPPLRKSRYFDAAATVKKVKAVCFYKAGPNTTQTIEQYKISLEMGAWTASERVCICHVRNIIEGMVRLVQAQTSFTSHIKTSREILLQIVDLIFSRCDGKGTQTASTLYYILCQLAFGFSFSEGTNHPSFGIFKAVTGISETLHRIPNVKQLLWNVVYTCEVLMFVTEVIHLYCTKYAREHLTEAKRISLACLTIYGDLEVIDYLLSLPW